MLLGFPLAIFYIQYKYWNIEFFEQYDAHETRGFPYGSESGILGR